MASLAGQIGAYTRIAQPSYDGREATRPAITALWAKYDDEVDPERVLAPDERERRAKAAWQRDMARAKLAKLTTQAKRRKRT
jgi:hypothetical protein